MGQLVNQEIRTLFQGVSRQPHNVRLPGQVQEADNLALSVVTGGFSKRGGSFLVANLDTDAVALSANAPFYSYKRDGSETYFITVHNGDLVVWDKAGARKTVTYFDSGEDYIDDITSAQDLSFVTIDDTTIIANKKRVTAMKADTVARGTYSYAVFLVTAAAFNQNYTVTLEGSTATRATAATANDGKTDHIANDLKTQLDTAKGASYEFFIQGSYVFIRENTLNRALVINQTSPVGDDYIKVMAERVDLTGNLLARAWNGSRVKVGPADKPGVWYQFTTDDGTDYGRGSWAEDVALGTTYILDETTMPHGLVRNADLTFTFGPIRDLPVGSDTVSWTHRSVGDEDSAPDPDFIGKKISWIGFHRDRLTILAESEVVVGQSGDYFHFWPNSTTDVIDSDPFARTAPSREVSLLESAIPFRRALFITSTAAQFEMSSPDALTPAKTALDYSTSYAVEPLCLPHALADEIYLPSFVGDNAEILEYYYDDDSLSNTADRVTIQVEGYIPSPLLQMVGDSVTGQLICRTGAAKSDLYVYRVYYNGTEKVQSAWARWRFNDEIRHAAVYNSEMYLILANADHARLVKVTLNETQSTENAPYPIRLDDIVYATGVYSAITGDTTWTIDADIHDADSAVVLSSDFGNDGGTLVLPTLASPTTLVLEGDYSAGEVLIGNRYNGYAKFSKQYLRGGEGEAPVTQGRLQLRYMTLNYQDSGNFDVVVTPLARRAKTHSMSGLMLGSSLLTIGTPRGLISGTFQFPVQSRGDTVDIEVQSDSHLPFTITSAAWVGFYNETSRQT